MAACRFCDNKGWVCSEHPDRPFALFSQRADACDCGNGVPCFCNTDPINDPRHGRIFVPVDQALPGKKKATLH